MGQVDKVGQVDTGGAGRYRWDMWIQVGHVDTGGIGR